MCPHTQAGRGLPGVESVLHGAADACNHPDSSANKERFFSGPYRRTLLDRVGHFPQREAPGEVANAILDFLEDAS